MPVAGSNKPAAQVRLRNGRLHIIQPSFVPAAIICEDHAEALTRLRNGEALWVSRVGDFISKLLIALEG